MNVPIFLKARGAIKSFVVLLIIVVLSMALTGTEVPTPFGLISLRAARLPIEALTPIATAIWIGLHLVTRIPELEWTSTRPLRKLDAGLLLTFAAAMYLPLMTAAILGSNDNLQIAARNHIFVIGAVTLASRLFGVRAGVLLCVLGLVFGPTLIPRSMDSSPPGFFVTMANATDPLALALTGVVWIVALSTILTSRHSVHE